MGGIDPLTWEKLIFSCVFGDAMPKMHTCRAVLYMSVLVSYSSTTSLFAICTSVSLASGTLSSSNENQTWYLCVF